MHRPLVVILALALGPAAAWAETAPPAGDGPVTFAAGHGTLPVGVHFTLWTDAEREEDWTPTRSDAREVGVRLFYPAGETAGLPRAPFFAQGTAVPDAMESSWGARPLDLVLDAYDGAPARPGDTRRPVVLLSHGLVSGHWSMTQLALDLASSGYVVAALEHPYAGLTFVRRLGEAIPPDAGASATIEQSRLKADMAMQGLLQVISEDQAFVARRIREVATGRTPGPVPGLAAAIDPQRIFVGGHSIGGMAADRSCIHYTAFDACFSLDGNRWLPILAGWSPPSGKPFLVLFSEAYFGGQQDRRFAERYRGTFPDLAAFVVAGARHDSFVNVQSLFSRTPAAIDPERQTHAAMVPLLLEFLSGASAGDAFRAAPLLERADETLQAVDFAAMLAEGDKVDLCKLYAETPPAPAPR